MYEQTNKIRGAETTRERQGGVTVAPRVHLYERVAMPGRPQRRALKRKQAASTCYRLDKFIKSADNESAEQGSPATAAAASSSNTTVEESLSCREISVGDVESDAEVSTEHPLATQNHQIG